MNTDTIRALELLDQIEEEIDRANAWVCLQQNAPESYDAPITKVEQAANRGCLATSGRSGLSQLARVSEWCNEHGMPLSTLEIAEHFHKYCAANAKPASVIKHGTEDDEIKQDLLAAIETIKSHENHTQTRSWARAPQSAN